MLFDGFLKVYKMKQEEDSILPELQPGNLTRRKRQVFLKKFLHGHSVFFCTDLKLQCAPVLCHLNAPTKVLFLTHLI